MSPKDQQIIKSNPGASPYDLMTKFNLSKGGYNELVAIADEQATNILKAGTPRMVANPKAAIPVTTVYQPRPDMNEQVTLRSKDGSTQGTLMSRTVAEKMRRKYPNKFEIV